MTGIWAQHMAIIDRARELDIQDGDFHPKSHISAGGGVKGVALPPDYMSRSTASVAGHPRHGLRHDRAAAADAAVRREALSHCAGSHHAHSRPARRKLHRAAGSRGGSRRGPLRLPRSDVRRSLGRTDLGRQGPGRLSALSLRSSGPTILDTIMRYSQVTGGDDHIGCAGTIDAYVRGTMS